MSESSNHLLCPMCLHVASCAVALPCGHSFCQSCLQTMDQGLDRHCCPQCRQEYHPHYHYCYCDHRDHRTEDCAAVDPGTNRRGQITQTRNIGERSSRNNALEATIEVKESGGFQRKTEDVQDSPGFRGNADSADSMSTEEHEKRRYKGSEVGDQSNGIGSEFQTKNQALVDSELFQYLQSKMVAPKVTEKVSREEDETGRDVFQSTTPLLKRETQTPSKEIRTSEDGETEEAGLEPRQNRDSPNKTPNVAIGERQNRGTHTVKVEEIDQSDSMGHETVEVQSKSPISEEDQRKMAESKSKLASRAAGLTLELEKAESWWKEEQQNQLKAMAANAKLRQTVADAVGDVTSFAQSFSDKVLKLMEQQMIPSEAEVHDRAAHASRRTDRLRKATQDAEELLKEQDPRVFTSKLQSVESELERCDELKQIDGVQEVQLDLVKLCPELERLHREFKEKLGLVQRSLRSAFNPSEITFDPETLHPNLVLSEDMKTVKFSAKKQQYAPSPQRFTSFFQVLSAQSFLTGVHRWELELEGAPWMLGVCAASALPRSGLPSALETCPESWALMWTNGLLTALERGRTVPLKKASEASRRLRLELDRDQRTMVFHQLSAGGGKTLIHRFSIDTEEPLQLAYRMLSGDSRGRLSVCS